jgi:hypothetical protein
MHINRHQGSAGTLLYPLCCKESWRTASPIPTASSHRYMQLTLVSDRWQFGNTGNTASGHLALVLPLFILLVHLRLVTLRGPFSNIDDVQIMLMGDSRPASAGGKMTLRLHLSQLDPPRVCSLSPLSLRLLQLTLHPNHHVLTISGTCWAEMADLPQPENDAPPSYL